MRNPVLALFLAILLAIPLAAPALWAEEEEAPPAAAEDAEADEEELVASPQEAYAEIRQELRRLRGEARAEAEVARSLAWLERWQATGREAEGMDHVYLVRLMMGADQHAEAFARLRAELADDALATPVRDGLAQVLGSALGDDEVEAAVSAEDRAAGLEALRAYVKRRAETDEDGVARLHWSLAGALDETGDDDGARAHWQAAGMVDPMLAASAAQRIVRGLMEGVHEVGAYDAIREAAEAPLAALRQALEAHVAELEGGDDPQALARAKGNLDRLARAAMPLALLGRPAPDWTLEHAFGDVRSLDDVRGDVVVLDFWATWCPWCIRSFPALRDLQADLGEEGLTIVGVTASAGTVYAHRYDLDDDLEAKGGAEYRARPAAMLDRGRPAPEGVELLGEEAYGAREKEVIAAFIGNHEMTWPVVMIEGSEPAAKYALSGWPHAVVLDRQGRVRYLKAGALLKDRPEQVAKFRALLEELLAEPAPSSGEG